MTSFGFIKVLLVVACAIQFCDTDSENDGYRRLVRSTTAVGETTSESVNGCFLWIIKEIRRFCSSDSVVRSPIFVMDVSGKKLHLLFRWEVYGDKISIYLNNYKTSELSTVRWKVLYYFVDSTTGAKFGNGSTSRYKENFTWDTVRLAQDHSPSYYLSNNHLKWNHNRVSELLPAISNQRELQIVFDITVIYKVTSQTKNTLDYLKRGENDLALSYSDFGKELLKDKENCDTEIVVIGNPPRPRQVFCVHRALLLQRAPSGFQNLLIKKDNSKTEITIDGIDENTFRELLTFVYTDEDPKTSSGSGLKNLLLASIRFKLPRLESICLERISREMTVHDALDWLKFAKENKIEILHNFAVDFMRQNSLVMGDEKWQSVLAGYVEITCDANSTVAQTTT